MSREIFAILLIAAAITIAVAFVGLRSRVDDGQGGSRADLSYFLTPGPGPTLTALELEEEELRSLATTATFRVSYETRDGDGRVVSTRTVFQLGERFRRVDIGIGNALIQTIVHGGLELVCDSYNRTCLTRQDAIAGFESSLLPFDGLRNVSNGLIDAASFGTALAEPTTPPMSTVLPATIRRTYAGERASCFVQNDGAVLSEHCYTDDGVKLFSHTGVIGIGLTEVAVSFSRDVSESDFTLPYPVVEPTLPVTTPISPPSSTQTH